MSVGTREATESGAPAKAARTMKDRDTLIEQSGNYSNDSVPSQSICRLLIIIIETLAKMPLDSQHHIESTRYRKQQKTEYLQLLAETD